ncbi:disease resistance RPP13-like protein 4 [Humulus lupulus]|uniref:disease resistance RPP13-like protein 4 n=1 Tax=Humulus lupulus TaxID=3486 RepID=UPI002B4065E0|nr:disease resistance RPP13-like protein 4 [Humulus lupulus]
MSSTTSKRTIPISSFETSYVSLELLSYLKSSQITHFQIFNEVIIPDFLRHLAKAKNISPPTLTENDPSQNGDLPQVEEASSSNNDDIHAMFEDIKTDVVRIQEICRRLEHWENELNGAMRDLVLQSLDDAFKERTGEVKTDSLQDKLSRTRDTVTKLKGLIYSTLKYDLNNSNLSFRTPTSIHSKVTWSVELPMVDIGKEIAVRSTFEEIRAVYEDLDSTKKLCLLCFSVFPENVVIKKKVLVHWWVGEGFIDSSDCGKDESVEKFASGFFKEFIAKGLIEPVFKKRRPSADSCRMEPSVRFAVIMLAERAGFIKFDANKNPIANFSSSHRACLVKSDDGSCVRELAYGFRSKQENVRTVFNVSEHRVEFKPAWFSKMKYVRVLQLGRWESSAKHLIEVEDSEFLKGLKKLKFLRYLSLRGVSRITELPNSISKLENLRILNLNGCNEFQKLPDGIGSLKKLTHLDMYECYLISHMPKGLASLSELRVLKGFVIGKQIPGGQYCKLEDLIKLEHLEKLSILVDKNSHTVMRELNSLANFGKLKSLSISWSRIYNSPKPQRSTLRRLTNLSRVRTSPFEGPAASTIPKTVEKFGLHYFPVSNISEWFSLGERQNLRKLYVRGGELANLKDQKCCWETVEYLRLKFLSKLKMDWREMKQVFPKLTYMEKIKCPQLSLFPCDENGIWKSEASQQDN